MSTTRIYRMPDITATRITEGTKTFVVIASNGVEVDRYNGKSGDRSRAVIVTQWGHLPRPVASGVRASLLAAETEADRLIKPQPIKRRGVTLCHDDGTPYIMPPAEWSKAVLIKDGE